MAALSKKALIADGDQSYLFPRDGELVYTPAIQSESSAELARAKKTRAAPSANVETVGVLESSFRSEEEQQSMVMTIEELSDREEIRQVIYRYFRGLDRLDLDLLYGAFWPDGEFVGGPNPGTSLDFIPAMFGENGRVRAMFEMTNHYMMNMIIDWHGDTAITETYAVAYHRLAPSRKALETILGATKTAELGENLSRQYQLVIGLRYQDRLEKRDGIWKIARKKLIFDWSEVTPYTGVTQEGEGFFSYTKLRGSRGERPDETYSWMK